MWHQAFPSVSLGTFCTYTVWQLQRTEMHPRLDVGLLVANFPKFLHFFSDWSLVIFFHKYFLYLIQLVQISLKTFVRLNSFRLKFFRIFRIGSGLDDLRLESLGLITCGSCVARVSANLLLIMTDWSLIAFLVDEVFAELLLLYRLCCVFLCRIRKSERGRWGARGERQVRQPRMTHVTPDNKILVHQDEMQIALGPWAKRMIVLCCAVCAVFMGVLSSFTASFVDIIQPLRVREGSRTFTDELTS